jgi:hypothetical protein
MLNRVIKALVTPYRLSMVVQQKVAILQPEQLLHFGHIHASTSTKVIQHMKSLTTSMVLTHFLIVWSLALHQPWQTCLLRKKRTAFL